MPCQRALVDLRADPSRFAGLAPPLARDRRAVRSDAPHRPRVEAADKPWERAGQRCGFAAKIQILVPIHPQSAALSPEAQIRPNS